MSWSANKGEIRLHLKDLNKEKTVSNEKFDEVEKLRANY